MDIQRPHLGNIFDFGRVEFSCHHLEDADTRDGLQSDAFVLLGDVSNFGADADCYACIGRGADSAGV